MALSIYTILVSLVRVMEDMRYLVAKYPGGYEVWAKEIA